VALWTTDSQLPQVLDRLTAATASGELPMDRVNQAATRVLTAKGVC
jgi:beta-N-acetylhexosaminidase